MLKPNVFTRQQFDHFLAAVAPDIINAERITMVVQIVGDEATVGAYSIPDTAASPTPPPPKAEEPVAARVTKVIAKTKAKESD